MKLFKKAVSFILVLSLLSSFAVYISVSANASSDNLPVIFIGGKGTTLIDKDGNVIFPMTIDIAGCVKKVLPSLITGNLKNNFDEFGEVLYETVAEQYKDLPLDANGNASNGTNTDFKWTRESLSRNVKTDKQYGIFDYVFYYDWRLDPCEIADSFSAYIDDVLAVTNSSKVNIIGRCMGSNIVLAYLEEYGASKVNHCLFYVSTINGAAFCGASFAGDFVIDSESVKRFGLDFGMDPVFTLGEAQVNELVGSALTVLHKVHGIDLATAAVKNVYDRVKDDVVPRLLLATYATFPSYWSMIDDDYYEAAKKCVFSGREDEYAGFIAKIDNYHYNIQTKAASIIKELEAEDSLELSVVCKYGLQQVPVSKEFDELSDDTVLLSASSFGATCAKLNETFSDKYIASAKKNNTLKYISPDKQVDSSTCLYPDNTWIIKNCTHSDFPRCIDELMMTIIRYDGRMTVNDNPNYPQYLVYDKSANTISPMHSDNFDTTQRWNQTVLQAIIKIVKIVFSMIVEKISTLVKK